MPSEGEIKSYGWTKNEDSIIAVVNHLYTDLYGLITQKALESYRPFPFQSTITAPSIPNRPQSHGHGKGQMTLGAHGQPIPAPPTSQPYTFPIRTPKQVLDRLMWQQKSPQDEIYGAEEVTTNPRFAPYLLEFNQWKSGKNYRKVPPVDLGSDSRCDSVWTWMKRDNEPTHRIYRNMKTEVNSVIAPDSMLTLQAGTSGVGLIVDEKEKELSHWDGRNKLYFSTGAKNAWWGKSSTSSSSSILPSSTNIKENSLSVQLSVPIPEITPSVDLDSFLLVGHDGDVDDMDLGFEFGFENQDDLPLDIPMNSNITAPTSSSSSSFGPSSASSSSNKTTYIEPIFKSDIVTERLFACSTDYNLDNDARIVQTKAKRTNAVVSCMRKAIRESERRRPPPPVLPGKHQILKFEIVFDIIFIFDLFY